MMGAQTLLYIVEDEPELAALMADYAHAAGYATRCFGDGRAALSAALAEPPDLMVLDLMLPGEDGLAVCRKVRARSQLPIIMVTARVEELDRLLGLEAGADDYLCKPFSPRELMARVKAVLRRTGGGREHEVFVVDSAGQRIMVRGEALDLTPTEYRLCALLMRRPGQVFSRAQLLDAVTPDGLEVTDRAVDSHVKNLRRKLTPWCPGGDPIQSVYGVGYRFDLPEP